MSDKKKLVLGILAHVDAGKTTLCEAMLYTCGTLRSLGRVDHRNTALDNYDIERKRGITVFSKQAQLKTLNTELCLLDTPGHVDFSAETERTLQVLDYAVLVISGTDGVQAHTETLWRLLRLHNVPTLIFATKMDLAGADKANIIADLKHRLSENCVDFTDACSDSFFESLAMCDEGALEEYMDSGTVCDDTVRRLISERRLFPVLFGSGLKLDGVRELLDFIDKYTVSPEYGDAFGARVYKILRDEQGNRLSCMKITGGTLNCRNMINGEKVTELRLYTGAKYENSDSVSAGSVVAVRGLAKTHAGQGLGCECDGVSPVLTPVLSYRIGLPKGTDTYTVMPKLKMLEDEDPTLRIVRNEQLDEIRIELMGEVQTEVISALIKERFDLDVTIDRGGIMYRETIAKKALGIGHFEPLRHYAEVQIVLEPLPAGSGIVIESACPDDMLSREWQSSVMSLLAQKEHLGVLTGSPLTDVKIVLAAGRAHVKHTEGGDFREAAYRAVRNALMQTDSVLLEPWYEFSIEVPPEHIGRAISDIRAKSGEFETEGNSTLRGFCPVSELNGYAPVLAAYTSGRGRISVRVSGYRPCHNEKEVIEHIAYDPEADLANTPDSVFCAHGAAMLIKWDAVKDYAHIDIGFGREKTPEPVYRPRCFSIDDRELEAIMEREFGPIKRREYTHPAITAAEEYVIAPSRREYLIVDGYNLIFAWDEMKKLSEDDLSLARSRLIDTLKSYRGFKACELVLVFDGYKVQGNPGERENDGIRIVYTKENETADMYIEKLANDIGKNYQVRIVTNDSLIRLSALRSGVLRMSSSEFINELLLVRKQISEYTDDR